MTTTNYKTSNNNSDLAQIFKKYTTGAKASTTNYRVGSNDLCNIFAKISTSSTISPIGYNVTSTNLNQIFASIDWSAFISGIYNGLSGGSASCYALIFDSSGNIYVGGSFTSVCNVLANNIAKFTVSTSTWSALGTSPNNGLTNANSLGGECRALAFDSSGNLYAGGDFIEARYSSTVISARRIAKWSVTSSTWSALGGTGTNNGLNGTCYALAFYSSPNLLYAGGNFTEVRNSSGFFTALRIARWTPSTSLWVSLGGLNSGCYALSLDSSGNLYAGGAFNTASNPSSSTITVNYIAKFTPTSNTWSALGSGLNGTCLVLKFDSSNNLLYAGGSFTSASTISANRIAKWTVTSSTWSALGSGLNSACYALAFDSVGNLYASGQFINAGGNLANRIACWTPSSSTWSALGTVTNNGLNGICRTIAFDSSGNLYVGGNFTTAGGITANGIAKRVYV